MKMKLTYFKPSGKFYEEGEQEVSPDTPLFNIWETAIKGFRSGVYPGLSESSEERELVVSIDVPGHQHEHPFLYIPNSIRFGQYHDPDREPYRPLRLPASPPVIDQEAS